MCAHTETALTAAAFGRDASEVESGVGEIAISGLCYDVTIAGTWVHAYLQHLVQSGRLSKADALTAAVASLGRVAVEALADDDISATPAQRQRTVGVADRDLVLHATWEAVGFAYLGSRSLLRLSAMLNRVGGQRLAVKQGIEHLASNDGDCAFLAEAMRAGTGRVAPGLERLRLEQRDTARTPPHRGGTSRPTWPTILDLRSYFLPLIQPTEALGWVTADLDGDMSVLGLLLAEFDDEQLCLVVEYVLRRASVRIGAAEARDRDG